MYSMKLVFHGRVLGMRGPINGPAVLCINFCGTPPIHKHTDTRMAI